MLLLAERFIAYGIRCDILIAMNKGHLLGCIPSGARLISFHKKKTINAIFTLAQYLRRERPDVVLATIYSANVTSLIAKRVSRTKTRTVIREANPIDVDIQSNNLLRTLKNWVVTALAYRNADAAILVSEDVRRSLAKWNVISPHRLHVIRNPLVHTRTKSRIRILNETKIALACGRLVPEKDHATLIRAFAKLRTSYNAELIILGDGPLLPTLQEQAEKLGIAQHVQFPGFVTDPMRLMTMADVFVHTSRYEGCSNVLIEALAAGCPIVATSSGGVREILDDGKYGTLVAVGDDDALAIAMSQVLDGVARFPNADDYLKRFNIDLVADAYLSVLFPNSAQDFKTANREPKRSDQN